MSGPRQENREGPERPHPSESFYLEKLLDYYNNRRMFVERGGHMMFRDSYRRARARRGDVPLKLQAHDTYLAYLWGDREGIDAFLSRLFPSWQHYPEERRSAVKDALFEVLRWHYCRPAADSLRNPPRWSATDSPNPKAWLAKRVWEQSTTILKKRYNRDKFAKRTAKSPLEPDRVDKLKGWGGNPDGGMELFVKEGRRVARWSHDIGGGRDHDPGEAVAAKEREWVQAVARIAEHGREVSRTKARILLRALRQGWTRSETIEAVGGPDAWRSLKTTLNDHYKKSKKVS